MSSKPIFSIASITAAGGGAPATIALMPVGRPVFISAGALASMLWTRGAPQKWLTRCPRIKSKMVCGSTLRRQTLTAARAASVHGKHQPLAWNIGSVQR